MELKGFLDSYTGKDDLTYFINKVKALESEIMDADLAEKDRNGLLQVTSIARHSAWFWTQLGPGTLPERNGGRHLPKWLKGILSVKAFICVDMLAMVGESYWDMRIPIVMQLD